MCVIIITCVFCGADCYPRVPHCGGCSGACCPRGSAHSGHTGTGQCAMAAQRWSAGRLSAATGGQSAVHSGSVSGSVPGFFWASEIIDNNC